MVVLLCHLGDLRGMRKLCRLNESCSPCSVVSENVFVCYYICGRKIVTKKISTAAPVKLMRVCCFWSICLD
jgi:hypothetical protein